jgi:hypothetical protein
LPLPCFDDRDLKEAQRQKKFSYREFIESNTNPSPTKGSINVASGQGKRGQPLKVILRDSDPKADMIVDVLVCLSTNLPSSSLTCPGNGYI